MTWTMILLLALLVACGALFTTRSGLDLLARLLGQANLPSG